MAEESANQCLGQFESIEVAAETSFGIGDDRRHPFGAGFALHVMNLVGAQQGIVDALHHARHRVDRVQTLIRIHLSGRVRIAGHLPTRAVDRLESRLHGLHGLIPGHAAERADDRFAFKQAPELLRAEARQRMLDAHGAAQPRHIGGGVGPFDAAPT